MSSSVDWSGFEDAPLEELCTRIPGPRSLEFARVLSTVEARGITYFSPKFPIFWESALGSIVVDVDGNRFIDLTSAFGVASVGHSNPRVLTAIGQQTQALLHGMGDVHPTGVRAMLLERLTALSPGALSKTYLGTNGADAVEFARKTALLVNGRPEGLAFEGAYHGLSYGTLEINGIARFRKPFEKQLLGQTTLLPYPAAEHISLASAVASVEQALVQRPQIGAIFIEPIAGRSGTLLPVQGFLPALRQLADRYQAVLVFDEIYTGFGRTGSWFACQHEAVTPDILCMGKALAGGLPLSAAVGTPAVMDAWPRSGGEALHTATFLGNPLACAAALAVIEEMNHFDLPRRAEEVGQFLGSKLRSLAARLETALGQKLSVRGKGMMWALDLHDANLATRSVVQALQRGVLILQQGMEGTALAVTPPLIIAHRQLERALELLEQAILRAAKDEIP